MKSVFGFNTVNGKYCCNERANPMENDLIRFNTVNGKYCCNLLTSAPLRAIKLAKVSIP